MNGVNKTFLIKKRIEATSLILYAKDVLGLKDICQLKSPLHIGDFLELILEQDVIEHFAPGQYYYAVTLILGRQIEFSSDEEVFSFLCGLRDEYRKINGIQILACNIRKHDSIRPIRRRSRYAKDSLEER